MATKTDIANMALGHLGVSYQVLDFATEKSKEAIACRQFMESAVKKTLEDFAWPVATRYVVPGLVSTKPTNEWSYALRLPSDCLAPRRFLTGLRNPGSDQRQPFRMTSDEQGKLLYCDLNSVQLEYTAYLDDPNYYSANLTLSISFFLAYLMAPQLTSGDPYKLMERSLQRYQMTITQAEAQAANVEQKDPEPDSEFIRGR